MALFMRLPWHRPFIIILHIFLFIQSKPLLVSSHFQNIETFYPSPIHRPVSQSQLNPLPVFPPPHLLPVQSPSRSPGTTILKAVVATAAGSAVLAGLFYFLLQRYVVVRRDKEVHPQGVSQLRRFSSMRRSDFVRYDGVLKGLIVDENGLDVLYWRKLTGQEGKSFPSNRIPGDSNGTNSGACKPGAGDSSRNSSGKVTIQKLERGLYSSPWIRKHGDTKEMFKAAKQHVDLNVFTSCSPQRVSMQPSTTSSATDGEVGIRPLPLPPALRGKNHKGPPIVMPPPPPPQPFSASSAVKTQLGAPELPLPPALRGKDLKDAPAPPPPPPANEIMAKPPPPPPKGYGIMAKPPPPPPKANGIMAKPPSPPPPPPKATGITAKPPPPPLPLSGKAAKKDEPLGDASAKGGPSLKPLHWEKVEVNGDNSMVWDKIGEGSFRVDCDLMEALFGSVATDRTTSRDTGKTSKASNSKPEASGKIFILDARKSQNIAIIVKSLGASRLDILEALSEGQGLTVETLEKLDRIILTKKEQAEIIRYDGDPQRLADAESFLYFLLKAFPSAFTRIRAMLFKLNYDSEITNLRETLLSLELACEELRARGVFVKLLEAILKAGNRMNAGTTRGNATAFDLKSLRKLSDVKSTDGKTTLLHFVVEEVIRSEGKRCVLNRSRRLSRNFSQSSSNTSLSSDSTSAKTKEERANEYIMLGLPAVGCLSVEFSNVTKAAGIDYLAFSASASTLMNRLSEIRELVLKCDNDQTGFQRDMKEFLTVAEEEIESLRKEQAKVMELVKKTTEYYQASASKDYGTDPLHIFVIVKDFLGMVDKVCLEIARNLQRSKRAGTKVDSSSEKSSTMRLPTRFHNMQPHSVLQNSSGSGSSESTDSDSDF